MSIDELERKIQKNALAIEELTIRIEALNRNADELLAELNVSHEQLTRFLGNKEHFTEENWKTLNEEQERLEAKLQLSIANIPDPIKTKKAFLERHVQPHWLFVR